MNPSLDGVSRPQRSLLFALQLCLSVGCLLILSGTQSFAQTGTFVDRWEETDLRVVSYNVNFDSIFIDDDDGANRAPKFVRVMQALQPDVVNLQEIYDHDWTDVVSLMNTILPLEGGASWYGHIAYDNVIVSKYPLNLKATTTIPAGGNTSVASTLVDLPDDVFEDDFYLMNNHFKCCGYSGSPEDIQRQGQADALANWMRDARTPGGYINLPADTPMAVVGDLNIVGSQQPLNTVITGDIVYNQVFGADSPPDWDGTDLTDAQPLHNGTGPANYTWRAGSTSRIDFVLYTDSVADVANKFVLNSVSMTPAQWAATGLEQYDTTFDAYYYDHLPLVVDFRLPLVNEPIPGDYDDSGYVDEDDFVKWRTQFGMAVNPLSESDGNGNSLVDAADYSIWRDNMGAGTPPEGAGSGAAIPEPGSACLWLLCVGIVLLGRKRRC